MDVVVDRLNSLPSIATARLVDESERDGWRFVRRLVDEWAAGTGRFDGPGERLFAAWVGGDIVGVCGLNVDPYGSDQTIGRVRRLYVLRACRGHGVGSRLVWTVVDAARGRFRLLRVRTENPEAGRLYERFGFVPTTDVPDCTHLLWLGERA